MSSRRFDLSMSRRTRRPKIFSENSGDGDEERLEKEKDHAAHHRSSLKELLAETGSRKKTGEGSFKSAENPGDAEVEDEAVECGEYCFAGGGETGEKRSSAALVVERKRSFVGKYMKVLNRLIKSKSYPAKRGSVIRLPLK